MVTNIFEKREVNYTPRDLQTTLSHLDELSGTFKGTYLRVQERWKFTARISSLLEMIQYAYGIKEWDLVDLANTNNAEILSRWMDALLDYRENRPVNFGKVWDDIKTTLDFTARELTLIETGSVDERIWAIFTLLVDPQLPIKY